MFLSFQTFHPFFSPGGNALLYKQDQGAHTHRAENEKPSVNTVKAKKTVRPLKQQPRPNITKDERNIAA